jgi:hypothetical protein
MQPSVEFSPSFTLLFEQLHAVKRAHRDSTSMQAFPILVNSAVLFVCHVTLPQITVQTDYAPIHTIFTTIHAFLSVFQELMAIPQAGSA